MHQLLQLVTTLLLPAAVLAQGAENTGKLVFKVDCTFLSEPVCCPKNKQDLKAFFQKESTQILLVNAGGSRRCTQVPMSPHIRTLWKNACEEYYGLEALYDPNQKDKVMATHLDAGFPGFKYISTVLNGCKRLPPDLKTGMPCYEFYLIGERKTLTGSPPVVWLVRKLMGLQPKTTNTADADFAASETYAKSRVTIVELERQQQQNNNNNNAEEGFHAFQMDLEFRTVVKFPRMLLKLLPASKEKVEERGTSSVRKVLLKDIRKALSAVRLEWLEECGQENVTTQQAASC